MEKETSDFCANKRSTDGLNTWCRGCTKAYKAEHYAGNKERIAAKNKAWREANPEKIAAAREAYYEKNGDKIRAKSIEWYSENREHARTYHKLAYQATAVERAEYGKKRYAEKRDEMLAKSKVWYQANKEKAKARVRNYAKNFPQKKIKLDAMYRASNREKLNLARRIWASNNPGKISQYSTARKARELQATPVWADFAEIHKVYAECARINRETGIAHNVDHIVPLKGKLVCGLHVHHNLQILTKAANQKKTNKFEVL